MVVVVVVVIVIVIIIIIITMPLCLSPALFSHTWHRIRSCYGFSVQKRGVLDEEPWGRAHSYQMVSALHADKWINPENVSLPLLAHSVLC